MRRTNIYITDEQVVFLSELQGTIAEHIRRAIDEYIQKIKSQTISASSSKGGNTNGQ